MGLDQCVFVHTKSIRRYEDTPSHHQRRRNRRTHLPCHRHRQRSAQQASRRRDPFCRCRRTNGNAARAGSRLPHRRTARCRFRPQTPLAQLRRADPLVALTTKSSTHHSRISAPSGCRRRRICQWADTQRVRKNGDSHPTPGTKLLCRRHQQTACEACTSHLRSLRQHAAFLPRRSHFAHR